MDRYDELVHRGILEVSPLPIPGKIVKAGSSYVKQFPVGSKMPPTYTVEVTFDQFMNCIRSNLFRDSRYFYHFIIRDEAVVESREECMLRYQFLKYLNATPYASFDFYLSDSALPAYIAFMEGVFWRRDECTKFHMSMDRNPTTMKKIPLEKAHGILKLHEEHLLWYSNDTLRLLRGKINGDVLDDTFQLKKIIREFIEKVNATYHIQGLDDFDKAYLAYHYLFDRFQGFNIDIRPRGITYATERTYRDPNGVQKLNPSYSRWESRPVGTYEHNKGVCTGQSRLFNSLLCNPYFQIPADAVVGTIPSGEAHCWSNFIINHRNYQCCTTMRGLFADLDGASYQADEDQYFTKLYPHASLFPKQQEMIKNHIKSLRK